MFAVLPSSAIFRYARSKYEHNNNMIINNNNNINTLVMRSN